jgi:hypothetical protein
MSSGKTLVIATLLFVSLLFAGSIYFPDTLFMSLADTSPTYLFLRGAIIVLLISILVTKPPRSLKLRAMIGAWSFLLAIQSIESLFSYELRLMDSLVFMEVAIILGIEALETRQIPVTKKHTPARRIPVVSA